MNIENLQGINESLQNSLETIKESLINKKIDLTTIKNELANIEYYNDCIYSIFENNADINSMIDDLQKENETLKMLLSNLLDNDYFRKAELKINYGIILD